MTLSIIELSSRVCTATAAAQRGPDVVNATAEGRASINIMASASFDKKDRVVRIASGDLKMGEIELQAKLKINFWGGGWSPWSGKVTMWDGNSFSLPN